MKPADVGRVTTDLPTAVSLALGALPQLEALLPDMQDLLKRPPKAEIERLRDRSLGLLFAHLLWVPRKSKALEADLEEGRVLRERLLAAADGHVKFDQMDADAVAAIREGAGHLDRAKGLIALAALFHVAWPAIAKQTLVTEAQLKRAAELGTKLVAELGGKALQVTEPAKSKLDAADRRNRAFRLFINDYNEIRRAVQFVRFHDGDADAFAPSLHRHAQSARAGRRPRTWLR